MPEKIFFSIYYGNTGQINRLPNHKVKMRQIIKQTLDKV